MQFSMLKYAVVALATHCTGVISQATPEQVVENINGLTKMSRDLQRPAQTINTVNGPLVVAGMGPFQEIILGFNDIRSTAAAAIESMKGMASVPVEESEKIFLALKQFVKVHQGLLAILIGKAGLFQAVPIIGAPVATALRGIEGIVDQIAFELLKVVQGRQSDIEDQGELLRDSLKEAIAKYDGLNVNGGSI